MSAGCLTPTFGVFGLRRSKEFPACAELLDRIESFSVIIPLQLLKELTVNLSKEEMRYFYELINHYPDIIEVDWERASADRIQFFQEQGCRKGDAVIAAHAEALGVKIIVSENRQFLQALEGLPFEIVDAQDALTRLSSDST